MLSLPQNQISWESEGKLDTLVSASPSCSVLPILHHRTWAKGLTHIYNKCSDYSDLEVMMEDMIFGVIIIPPIIPQPHSQSGKSIARFKKVCQHHLNQLGMSIDQLLKFNCHYKHLWVTEWPSIGMVCVSINYEHQALSACHCHCWWLVEVWIFDLEMDFLFIYALFVRNAIMDRYINVTYLWELTNMLLLYWYWALQCAGRNRYSVPHVCIFKIYK